MMKAFSAFLAFVPHLTFAIRKQQLALNTALNATSAATMTQPGGLPVAVVPAPNPYAPWTKHQLDDFNGPNSMCRRTLEFYTGDAAHHIGVILDDRDVFVKLVSGKKYRKRQMRLGPGPGPNDISAFFAFGDPVDMGFDTIKAQGMFPVPTPTNVYPLTPGGCRAGLNKYELRLTRERKLQHTTGHVRRNGMWKAIHEDRPRRGAQVYKLKLTQTQCQHMQQCIGFVSKYLETLPLRTR